MGKEFTIVRVNNRGELTMTMLTLNFFPRIFSPDIIWPNIFRDIFCGRAPRKKVKNLLRGMGGSFLKLTRDYTWIYSPITIEAKYNASNEVA